MNQNYARSSLVVIALIFRTAFFAITGLIFAFYFSIFGSENPLEQASVWWTYQVILVGILTFIFVMFLLKREGIKYLEFISFQKERVVKDLGLGLGLGVLSALVGGIGLYGSAFIIYGGMPPETMIQPLPIWAVFIALFLMPVSVAAVETPLYLGYASPRLQVMLKSKWSALFIVSFAFAFQHISLPLLFDYQFMLWRVFSYLPLALMLAVIFFSNKRLFPIMIAHFLLDLQAIITILIISLT
ncbi:type II CAAX prenyl endopeptidase Rce1 family protein [Paraliobacillus quinghaiensis]|uniref:CPBP family glutamic-type intramembrane protease n=1 Tax=Paraliobacillus quinghaiensis TaxID=470815 RepID=UPI000E3C9FCA|nr:CPBP family glutamic-type intramembrane protease [Paraliobacillus quinghaiensis]